MQFKGDPNLFVRINIPTHQRQAGRKGFSFDKDGCFETENEFLIKLLDRQYQRVEEENNVTDDKPTDEQIRALAKEKKIRNWHNAKIENLIEKLKEV